MVKRKPKYFIAKLKEEFFNIEMNDTNLSMEGIKLGYLN
jgi:hypothetical protein